MKKYIHYSLIIFIISIFLLSSVFGKDNLFLVGRIIVIDPGHGYLDPGTSYENIYEKDINLNISLYLKEKLESYGATVYMTRDGDYDLSTPNAIYRKKSDFDNRINLINNSKADIYLSIHLNYLSDFKYYGPQVFYNGKNFELLDENNNIICFNNTNNPEANLISGLISLAPKTINLHCAGMLSDNTFKIIYYIFNKKVNLLV